MKPRTSADNIWTKAQGANGKKAASPPSAAPARKNSADGQAMQAALQDGQKDGADAPAPLASPSVSSRRVGGLATIHEDKEIVGAGGKKKKEDPKKAGGFFPFRRSSEENTSATGRSLRGKKENELMRLKEGECMLKVKVVGGEGIKTARGKTFSAFVNLILPGSVVATTFTVKRSSEPFWDQFADLPVNPWVKKTPDGPKEFHPPRSLFVELWEETSFGAKKVKGKARISLQRLVQGVTTDCVLELPPVQGKLFLQLTALGFGRKPGSRGTAGSNTLLLLSNNDATKAGAKGSGPANASEEDEGSSSGKHKRKKSSGQKSSESEGEGQHSYDSYSSGEEPSSDKLTRENSGSSLSGSADALAAAKKITYSDASFVLQDLKDAKWTTDLRAARDEVHDQHNKYGVP